MPEYVDRPFSAYLVGEGDSLYHPYEPKQIKSEKLSIRFRSRVKNHALRSRASCSCSYDWWQDLIMPEPFPPLVMWQRRLEESASQSRKEDYPDVPEWATNSYERLQDYVSTNIIPLTLERACRLEEARLGRFLKHQQELEERFYRWQVVLFHRWQARKRAALQEIHQAMDGVQYGGPAWRQLRRRLISVEQRRFKAKIFIWRPYQARYLDSAGNMRRFWASSAVSTKLMKPVNHYKVQHGLVHAYTDRVLNPQLVGQTGTHATCRAERLLSTDPSAEEGTLILPAGLPTDNVDVGYQELPEGMTFGDAARLWSRYARPVKEVVDLPEMLAELMQTLGLIKQAWQLLTSSIGTLLRLARRLTVSRQIPVSIVSLLHQASVKDWPLVLGYVLQANDPTAFRQLLIQKGLHPRMVRGVWTPHLMGRFISQLSLADLLWSFGVVLTIKDWSTLYRALRSGIDSPVLKRLRRLLNSEGTCISTLLRTTVSTPTSESSVNLIPPRCPSSARAWDGRPSMVEVEPGDLHTHLSLHGDPQDLFTVKVRGEATIEEVWRMSIRARLVITDGWGRPTELQSLVPKIWADSLALNPYLLPRLAWKLFPGSWVIDSFMDIESVLGEIAPSQLAYQWQFFEGCVTRKTSAVVSYRVLPARQQGDYDTSDQASGPHGMNYTKPFRLQRFKRWLLDPDQAQTVVNQHKWTIPLRIRVPGWTSLRHSLEFLGRRL